MNRRVLHGWTQISAHLQRGVRTVQRWEMDLGMPVHRPKPGRRRSVMAFFDELAQWSSRRTERADPFELVQDSMASLAWHTAELASQTRALNEQLRQSVETHSTWTATRVHPRPLAPGSRRMGEVLPFRPNNPLRRSNLTCDNTS
jgi:hypothetical protein